MSDPVTDAANAAISAMYKRPRKFRVKMTQTYEFEALTLEEAQHMVRKDVLSKPLSAEIVYWEVLS